jgi:hypothetical protein
VEFENGVEMALKSRGEVVLKGDGRSRVERNVEVAMKAVSKRGAEKRCREMVSKWVESCGEMELKVER